MSIRGATSIGRATIVALDLNRALLVRARAYWMSAGWHPPEDSDTGAKSVRERILVGFHRICSRKCVTDGACGWRRSLPARPAGQWRSREVLATWLGRRGMATLTWRKQTGGRYSDSNRPDGSPGVRARKGSGSVATRTVRGGTRNAVAASAANERRAHTRLLPVVSISSVGKTGSMHVHAPLERYQR